MITLTFRKSLRLLDGPPAWPFDDRPAGAVLLLVLHLDDPDARRPPLLHDRLGATRPAARLGTSGVSHFRFLTFVRQHLRRQHDATHLSAAGNVLFLGALGAAASTAATAAAAAEVDVSGVDVGCAVAADLAELSQERRGAISGLKCQF